MTANSMTATIAPQSDITHGDRLTMTIFMATIIHGILILGIGFSSELGLDKLRTPPAINIILVQTESPDAPDEAEFLAQANQQASGSSDEKGRPSSPVTSMDPRPHQGQAPVQLKSAAPHEQQEDQTKVLKQQQSPLKVADKTVTETKKPDKQFSGQQLIDRSLEIARLTSELSAQEQRYSQRPRVRFIDAVSAKSVVEASYIESWVRKVERIGNLNYPDEASRNRLSGKLILHVRIDQEGEVLGIEVAQSSGEQVLDDAAKRIVELSAPFSAFPKDMRKTYDQLMITRTWVFHSNRSLTTE
jgi:protein TonB